MLTPTADIQSAEEQDSSLHALPHAFEREVGHGEVLSLLVEKCRSLNGKKSSTCLNNGSAVVSTYNHRGHKIAFRKGSQPNL